VPDNSEIMGEFQSPGGFVFGVQGWTWGEPRPKSITWFLDGSAKVSDQHGRPIKGAVVNNKPIYFADSAPKVDKDGRIEPRPQFATHMQVIEALEAEGIEWQSLTSAGWPQIPYEKLKELKELPMTPKEELMKIRNQELRRDALRARNEADEATAKEMASVEE
jgi:hypothetical protein